MSFRQKIKKIIPSNLFEKVAPYGHLLESVFYQTTNGFPAKNLKVIGVTGTDGKTSTSTMIAHVMRDSGKKVALLGTIDFDLGEGFQDNNSRLTTVGSKNLVKLLKKIKDNGCEYLVLETTSHALAEFRTWGVPYYIVAMTNIGHEHLDYHKTFENYRDAKLKLFKLANKNSKGLRIGLVNAEDPRAELFAANIEKSITYGIKMGDLTPSNLKLKGSGSSYNLKFSDKGKDHNLKIKLNLPGEFNVSNSLAAVGICSNLGLSDKQIEQGFESLTGVKGRMQSIDEGQDFDLVIDYAHTPDSFEKIFKMFKTIAKGRIIAVFGSAGRRDEEKRAKQGEVAARYSDIVIATEEDDRDQDGFKILQQIASGAKKHGKKQGLDLLLIHKREDAVKRAIQMAKKGDLVLLLGKGHEQSILTNKPGLNLSPNEVFDEEEHTLKRDYNEEQVARKYLKLKVKGDLK